jgi:hypothetical protein
MARRAGGPRLYAHHNPGSQATGCLRRPSRGRPVGVRCEAGLSTRRTRDAQRRLSRARGQAWSIAQFPVETRADEPVADCNYEAVRSSRCLTSAAAWTLLSGWLLTACARGPSKRSALRPRLPSSSFSKAGERSRSRCESRRGVGFNCAPLARASCAGEGSRTRLSYLVILLDRATADADRADRPALAIRERDAARKRDEAAVGDLDPEQRRTGLA